MDQLHLEPIPNIFQPNISHKNDTITNFEASFSQSTSQFSIPQESPIPSPLSESNISTFDGLNKNSNSDDQHFQGGSSSKRKYFTKEEDHLLTAAAMRYNQESWNNIAKCVPGKTPKQCRDRWVNYLQPSLQFSPWSENEDQLLVTLVNELGTHWTKMRSFFPNRSTNCLKNRWYWLIKNRIKAVPIQRSVFYGTNDSSNEQFQNLQQNNNLIFEQKNNIKNNQNDNNNNQYISNNINFNTNYSITNANQQNNNTYFYLIKEKGKKKKSSILKLNKEHFNKGTNYNQKMKKRIVENNISEMNSNIFEENELISFNPEELDW